MRFLIILISIALVGGGVWYFSQGDEKNANAGKGHGGFGGPVLVIAQPVQYKTIVESIEAIGTAQANESVTLTAKVSDIVSRVNFEDGDSVERGKILIELANEEQSALLAEARANLEDATTQLRRLKDLGNKKLVPDSDIDEAKAQANAAKARLDSIAARMQDRLVRAPFSGVLGFREVSTGTLLTNNTPITTLDDISVIKLDFTIPEIHLNALQPGFKIQATSEAFKDQLFEGDIRTIGSRVDPVTRAVTVRAIIPNQERLLRPGMLLGINIIISERTSLVVPESAVTQVGDETYVFLAGKDGKAKKQNISIGARRFGYMEVNAGLKDGEVVITEGAFKLRDGAAIKVQDMEQNDKREFADKSNHANTPG